MSMMNFDAGKMVEGSASAPLPGVRAKPQLSPLAQLAAAQQVAPAFSPIVVAGMVRAVEFVLIALIGIATYFGYVYSTYGHVFDWYYIATPFGVAALAMIAFQAADIYQIQAFRNPVSQCARLTVAWSIVFLLLVALVFFAQLGGMYSRVWLSGYYGIGLFTLYGMRLFLYGIVRRWTREGRLDRRAVVVGGGSPGENLVSALERQRESDVSLVGVFDDRGDDRAPTACAGLHKLCTVDELV
jgi:FlaA1/EpsC-like NDP-sugar epimerase